MSNDSDSNSQDVLVAKCAAMACMFLATVCFGVIPFLLNCCLKWTEKGANARSAKVVTWLLYFGGGVLLATTFVHLLPEVQEVVEHLQLCGQIKKVNFAIPEVLMCAGFFLMYLIEEIIHSFLHRNKKQIMDKDDGVGAAFERGHSVRKSVLVKGVQKENKKYEEDDQQDVSISSAATTVARDLAYDNVNYQASNDASAKASSKHIYAHHNDLEIQSSIAEQPPICNTQPHTLEHSMEHSHKPSLDHSHNYSHEHAHDHGGHGHSHLPLPANENDAVITSSLRGLGIVLALSLHEVFEGLAIGLEDDTSSVWFLFAAVSAHKLVLAFCVGVELIVSRTRPVLAAIYTITFAIVSPIGVAIGIAVSHNSSGATDSIPSMVLQGIACGTLLYVVFFEILSKNHAGLGAFLAMLIGFGVMFGLQNIGEPGNSDENTCSGSVEAIIRSTTTKVMDLTATKSN